MSVNPNVRSAGMSGMVDANGNARQGWGLVDAPPEPPIKSYGEEETPNFGLVDTPPKVEQTPAEIKVNPEEPPKYTSVPIEHPKEVAYTEPPAPSEKLIEVAGSGMGASEKYSMYPSEALAVYNELKKHGGNMSFDDMAKALKEDYGMDVEQKGKTLVDKATGNVVAADTNGNGSLDMSDLNFKDGLAAAGIDPDYKPNPAVFSQATSVVMDAMTASRERTEDEEKAYAKLQTEKSSAARADAAKAGTGTATTGGKTGDTTGAAPVPGAPVPGAPVPGATPSAPVSTTTAASTTTVATPK